MKKSYTDYPRTLLWLVRGGEITIGGEEAGVQPGLRVEIAPFYISKFPITNEQYESFEPRFKRSPQSPGDRDPAVRLSYVDALAYTDWYADIAAKPFRLPTEIEWEYACRAGCESRYFFAEDQTAERYIWSLENSAGRVPELEAKKPNAFGLYGMLGGVWDWTSSLYAPYPPDRSRPPAENETRESRRVLRGGSYLVPRDTISCRLRRGAAPDACFEDVGFRIAKDLRPKAGT